MYVIWKRRGFFSPFAFGCHHFAFLTPPPRIRLPPTDHHRRPTASSAPRWGPSSACPPSSPPGRLIYAPPHLPWHRGAPATMLAASASIAAATGTLEPDVARATVSQLSPPVPCGPLCRMPAAGEPSRAPPEPPTPPHGPSSQTPPLPPSRTPVHRHRPQTARRTPDAHRPPASCSPLSTASLWPTAHWRK
jgi:hypothetical protein